MLQSITEPAKSLNINLYQYIFNNNKTVITVIVTVIMITITTIMIITCLSVYHIHIPSHYLNIYGIGNSLSSELTPCNVTHRFNDSSPLCIMYCRFTITGYLLSPCNTNSTYMTAYTFARNTYFNHVVCWCWPGSVVQ